MAFKGERKEVLQKEGLRLLEETEILRESLMWGPAGVEAVVAQLLVPDSSLFYDQFDVMAARGEFSRMAKLFQEQGVNIIMVRDELAKYYERSNEVPRHQGVNALAQDIIQRGLKFRRESNFGNAEVLDLVTPLILADAEKYGERVALLLNERLINMREMPMANSMYARDQSTVVGDTFFWSNMRRTIRRPEVPMYQDALGDYLKGKKVVEVTGAGHLEGGDVIVNGGICYVGVGGRTNTEGVRQIAPHILSQGLRVMEVHSVARDTAKIGEMDVMHLDTFFMPFSINNAVLCEQEAENRVVFEYFLDDQGQLQREQKTDFLTHLEKERGVRVLGITKEEQEAYAPNFQNLGDRRVVLPLTTNERLIVELESKGVEVLTANIFNITRGYGATHCSMAPTIRK